MADKKKELTTEEQVESLLASNADKDAIIEDLTGQLSQKDVEIKRVTDALAEAEELIGEQQTALSAPAADDEKIYVTHDKVKYHARTPKFRLDGRLYEAKDLKGDKALVGKLIERKSSVLVAVK